MNRPTTFRAERPLKMLEILATADQTDHYRRSESLSEALRWSLALRADKSRSALAKRA
jgi:hypothetical protein